MFRIKLCKTIQRLITTVMKGYSFTQQFLRVLKYHFVLGIVNFPVTPEALLYFRNGNIKLIVQSKAKIFLPFRESTRKTLKSYVQKTILEMGQNLFVICKSGKKSKHKV